MSLERPARLPAPFNADGYCRPLPLGAGTNLLAYLRAAAALDTQPSPLDPRIQGRRAPAARE